MCGGVPSPEPRRGVIRVEQVDAGNDPKARRRLSPCFVAFGVPMPVAVANRRCVDAQAEHGPRDVSIKGFAELGRRGAEVALHPLALGIADLPPIGTAAPRGLVTE
jgi:hypothetical protein